MRRGGKSERVFTSLLSLEWVVSEIRKKDRKTEHASNNFAVFGPWLARTTTTRRIELTWLEMPVFLCQVNQIGMIAQSSPWLGVVEFLIHFHVWSNLLHKTTAVWVLTLFEKKNRIEGYDNWNDTAIQMRCESTQKSLEHHSCMSAETAVLDHSLPSQSKTQF